MSKTNRDASFMQEMQDVKPLSTVNKMPLLGKVAETLAQRLKREALERRIALDDNGLSVEYVTLVSPFDFITYKQDGIQDGVYKNLRLGKYDIDTRLVLKHLNFDQARFTIYDTLQACHERGIRCILIDHGMGRNSKPFAGFMKSYVNQWLREMKMVIAFHTALKQHGGLAAVYVLLKKHANQKQINREQHQKRG